MTVRRVDQGMAKAAADLLPEQVSDQLRTRYKQLRVMLHTAGLAATYAFIASKSGEDGDLKVAYQTAGDGIRNRLSERGLLGDDARPMNAREVLAKLGGMSPVEYARASAEAQAVASWLSRLAEATYQAAKADAGDTATSSSDGPAGGSGPAGDQESGR